jgi:hypothetical protein
LFYAFGGARVGFTNAKMTIDAITCYQDRTGPRTNVAWTFTGMVHVKDFYTFQPVGPLHIRMAASDYRAARYLEMNMAYRPFNVILKWNYTMSSETRPSQTPNQTYRKGRTELDR